MPVSFLPVAQIQMGSPILLLLAAAALVGAGLVVRNVRQRWSHRRRPSDPLLSYRLSHLRDAPRAKPADNLEPVERSAPSFAPSPPPARQPAAPAGRPAPVPATVGAAEASFAAPEPEPWAGGNGRTVRYDAPLDGTLQLLPGGLEVVQGGDRGQMIRFVKLAGGRPQITFGRREGPPYRHVQLQSATVSREHARLEWDSERWQIVNLSQTNPVVVNGQELPIDGGSRPLAEGDRVEMGEVVFEFRER